MLQIRLINRFGLIVTRRVVVEIVLVFAPLAFKAAGFGATHFGFGPHTFFACLDDVALRTREDRTFRDRQSPIS